MAGAGPETAGMDEVQARFRGLAGRDAEAFGRAPGRVNLIGEHTDYAEGLALPCAIDRHTVAIGARRDDRRVVAHAIDLGETADFDPRRPERRGDWLDYVQAVVFALGERGIEVPGAELSITSRVPTGAGVSSSAALGVSVCGLLDALVGAGLGPRDWAEVAHRGESHFVGVGCGILDQFASALGRRDHALRLDCRSREATPMPFAGAPLAILLVHSGVTRTLAADGVYVERVRECEAAFDAAQSAGLAAEPARTLRDVSVDALAELERLLDPVLFARARHVVTENERVERFCAAMERGDHDALGAVLAAGQASLRDDYAVSTPELDHLCALGEATAGVVGSRLTGAGFGGCTLHLVAPERLDAAEASIAEGFRERFGRRPRTFAVRAADGAEANRLVG